MTITTRTEQLPIDFALYLPERWLTDEKRVEARIPWDVKFATKPQLGLQIVSKRVR